MVYKANHKAVMPDALRLNGYALWLAKCYNKNKYAQYATLKIFVFIPCEINQRHTNG